MLEDLNPEPLKGRPCFVSAQVCPPTHLICANSFLEPCDISALDKETAVPPNRGTAV